MNKKEAGELEDRPQASGMSGMNMMMGMMVACCIAAIVFPRSLEVVLAGGWSVLVLSQLVHQLTLLSLSNNNC